MSDRSNNRKYLKEFRKELRNNATKSESLLWKALQRKQLENRRFRRQHSLGNYFVDFYCPSEKLVVELDGQVHENFINQQYDFQRTQYLESLDLKVIRFENHLVFKQLDMVLEAIKSEFKR